MYMYDQEILRQALAEIKERTGYLFSDDSSYSGLEVNSIKNTLLAIIREGCSLDNLDEDNNQWLEGGGEPEQVDANFVASAYIRELLSTE